MQVYRSGLVDSVYRVAVNLKGGPAMPVEKLITWKEKRLIGVSLKVIAPTGQYDPTKLVTGVLTGGPSSLNSATRKPGANGFWTHTLDVVLHHQSGVLFAQCRLSGNPFAITKANGGIRRAYQLRRQTPALGLARRQLLGRRKNRVWTV